MKFRQFISILGVVALVAVIYSPSTIGLSASRRGTGAPAPTDTVVLRDLDVPRLPPPDRDTMSPSPTRRTEVWGELIAAAEAGLPPGRG